MASSDITKHGTVNVPAAVADAPVADEGCGLDNGLYLFKTSTCPNCKIAIALLNKANIPYEEIMAYENEDLAVALGVRQAPTLVVVANGEADKYAGVSEVKKFIEAANGAAI